MHSRLDLLRDLLVVVGCVLAAVVAVESVLGGGILAQVLVAVAPETTRTLAGCLGRKGRARPAAPNDRSKRSSSGNGQLGTRPD